MAVKVFISYKHQDAKRNQWVEKLYRDLRASGIDAKLDKFEVAPGQSFSNYMTKGIRDCNYVLFIVTPNAVKAVESGHGALAFEMQISNARRLAKRKKFSIIPIFREGNKTSTYLMDHRYLDFRIDANYEINLQQLIKWLNGEIQPPPLGGNTAAPRDDLVIQKQKLLEPISALAETLQSSNIQELSYIYALLEQIREIESKSFISIADFLNPICRSIEATCVFTLRIFPNGDLQIERSSDYLSSEVSGESFYSSMLKEIKQLLDKNRSLDTGLVFFDMREKSDLANNSIFLMELDTKFHFLVITAKQWNITPNANILGQTLFSLYKATDKFKFLDVLEAEERILDDIKLIYGHIPQEIYERRYDLYKYQLRFTTCYFQPVVYVADNEVAVDSWEALPWNAEKKELVSDLLIAADLWGERFSLEFDLYFLRESILRYIEETRRRSEKNEMVLLSINVFPTTLLRTVFWQELDYILNNYQINGNKIVFEISEKKPIPQFEDKEDYYTEFLERLNAMAKKYEINYAIDSFGVGYSSTLRLVRFQPLYVKIDEYVLSLDEPRTVLRFTNQLLHNSNLRPIRIIVTGIGDISNNIAFSRIHGLDIHYYQGDLIRSATPNIHDLDDQEIELLKSRIQSLGS